MILAKMNTPISTIVCFLIIKKCPNGREKDKTAAYYPDQTLFEEALPPYLDA